MQTKVLKYTIFCREKNNNYKFNLSLNYKKTLIKFKYSYIIHTYNL